MSKFVDFYLIGELVDSHGNVHYEYLKNLPTADVVDVVRCKDCKFQGHIQRCPFGKRNMPHANGYCCYGERREDDKG